MLTDGVRVNSDPIHHIQETIKRMSPKLRTPTKGSLEDYFYWRLQVCEKLTGLLGLKNIVKVPPRIAGYKETYENGMRRFRFFLRTEEDYWAPVIVNVPEGDGPFPLILCPHGHCENGKDGVSGLIAEIPGKSREEMVSISTFFRDTYAADLTARGFLTVSLDNRDFNQAMRIQPYDYNEYSWHLTNIAWQNAVGRTYAGTAVWDLLSVLDYMIANPLVNQEKIGCIGFSLGGMLTLYASLLDDRISASVIAGYLPIFYERIKAGRGADCLCNYVPGLLEWFDIPDLVAALSPRPLLVVLEGLQPEPVLDKIRNVYSSMDSKDNFSLHRFEAAHHIFNGDEAYPWFEKELLGD